MKLPLILLALALLSGPASALQTSGASRLPRSHEDLVRDLHGVSRVDGALLGGAHNYAVEFGVGARRFQPFTDRPSERVDVEFDVVSARVGTSWFALQDGAASPTTDGELVRFDHGSFEERWDVGREGVELSFVFDELPRTGEDLVVELRLDTVLVPHEVDLLEGVVLGDGERSIATIGGVTGIDAEGLKAAGTIDLAGERLMLSLPGEFVATASFPLVLDPIIKSNTVNVYGSVTDVAREGNISLLVYDVASVVRAYALSVTGTQILPVFFTIDGFGNNRDARVGSFDGGWFVIAWEAEPFSAKPYIQARALNYDDAIFPSMTPVIDLTQPSATKRRTPDVGKGKTVVPIVWEEEGGGIEGTSVTLSGGTLVQGANYDVSQLAGDVAPKLSSSDPTLSWTACTWIRKAQFPQTIDTVYGRRWLTVGSGVASSGHPEFPVRSTSRGMDHADVAGAAGNDLFFVWDEGEPSTTGNPLLRDIKGRRISFPKPGSSTPTYGPVVSISAGQYDDQAAPSIEWARGTYVVAYLDYNAQSKQWFPLARALDCMSGALLETIALGSNVPNEYPLPIASESDTYTGAYDEVLIFTNDETYRVGGVGGEVRDLGGACTFGPTARVSAARDGNSSFTHELWSAVPNAPTFFSISLGTSPLALGSATYLPDLDLGRLFYVGLTDANGFASKSTPVSGLSGVTLYEQWSVYEPGSTCNSLEFWLSNALEVEIE